MNVGITGYGSYLPRLRLSRSSAAETAGWLVPMLNHARGHRTLAGWDEDALTMAVEAARDCLRGSGTSRTSVEALYFASLHPPFAERPSANVIAGASGLPRSVRTLEFGGSRRAGLGALGAALDAVAGGRVSDAVVVAAEIAGGRAASPAALRQGDGAAALRVGRDELLAVQLGGAVETVDFVDSVRATGQAHEDRWEDRWVRDEGYRKLVPPLLVAAMSAAGVDATSIRHTILPTPFPGLAAKLAAAAGIDPDTVVDHLDGEVGDTGTAHPLMLLGAALAAAAPGDRILLAAMAGGCEAMVFEASERVADYRPHRSLVDRIRDGRTEDNYFKYLVWRGLVDWDRGSGAEAGPRVAMSALHRHERHMLVLEGLHCAESRQTFFGPEAAFKAELSNRRFAPRSFADSKARLVSSAADFLTPSPSPPSVYGLIEFEEGGRLNVDFADADPSDVVPGAEVEMAFRIHSIDGRSACPSYYWKAVLTPDRQVRDADT